MPVPAEISRRLTTISPGFYGADFQAMGSVCQIRYQADSPEGAEGFLSDVICWLRHFEARYSRYSAGSLINEINRNAGGGWVEIDGETERLFAECDWAVSVSQGCFDPSALPLILLWDYKAGRTDIPDEESIAEALSHVGWHGIERRKGAIRLPRKGMGIDIGGIGKEYAVDHVVDMALERGFENIIVDFGQDLRVHGAPPEGGAWRIGLENPSEPGRCWSGVALQGGAVATSGDYRRNFSLNGERYGHIIDPGTGYPVVNKCLAVSVIAPLCTQAGVLATAAFIVGRETGLALIGNQERVEGCIVAEDGLGETSNFKEYRLS